MWMATFIPDVLYLCGKPSERRKPARPAVSLCVQCLTQELERELQQFSGRVIAFEPDESVFTQYFFVGKDEFSEAGLQDETAAAISGRFNQPLERCVECQAAGNWLWIPREEVSNLDETARIAFARGESFCARHGARKLCEALSNISEANLFYLNVPYGDAGAYVWI